MTANDGDRMPENTQLEKAKLIELEQDLSDTKPGGKSITVQFNPETLKLSYANSTPPSSGTGSSGAGGGGTGSQSGGTPSRQFLGAGTTKLSLQLWFDVTAPSFTDVAPDSPQTQGGTPVDDVRKLTQEVIFFMKPQESVKSKDGGNLVPPGVRFQWGSFKFDGLVDSLDESLEFFSNGGNPLRASITLNLSQQKILQQTFADANAARGRPGVGAQPITAAPAGASVQGLAASLGRADDWQGIAAANGIENPRLLQPGQLVNLNPPGLRPGV
jgi:hypothetical protein